MEHTPKPFPAGYKGIPFIIGEEGIATGVRYRGVLSFSLIMGSIFSHFIPTTFSKSKKQYIITSPPERLFFSIGDEELALFGRYNKPLQGFLLTNYIVQLSIGMSLVGLASTAQITFRFARQKSFALIAGQPAILRDNDA